MEIRYTLNYSRLCSAMNVSSFEGDRYKVENINNHLDDRLQAVLMSIREFADQNDDRCCLPVNIKAIHIDEETSVHTHYDFTLQKEEGGSNVILTKISGTQNGLSVEVPITPGEDVRASQVLNELRLAHRNLEKQKMLDKHLAALQRAGVDLRDFTTGYWTQSIERDLERLASISTLGWKDERLEHPFIVANYHGNPPADIPSVRFIYQWNAEERMADLLGVEVQIGNGMPYEIRITADNRESFGRELYRAMDMMVFKHTIEGLAALPKGCWKNVKEQAALLRLQGFAPRLQMVDDDKEEALERRMFEEVRRITNDSEAAGTSFFTIPTRHTFPDGSQMSLQLNFLYNKEAELLSVHTVRADYGGAQDIFVPDKDLIIPHPSVIRTTLEHKETTAKALALLNHTPSTKALTV